MSLTFRSKWMAVISGTVALALTLTPGAAGQDWTADCPGHIEAMLLPVPLEGTYYDGSPARVRAIIVNDCDSSTVWFVATNGEGATFLATGREIILDDRPSPAG